MRTVGLHCQLRREIDALVHLAHGSVFDTITTSTFAVAKVVLATRSVLKSFETVVSPIFQRILKNTGESSTLKGLRDAMLPKRISGELRLQNTERFVREVIG